MTLILLHSKMFDVGLLPVLTFGDCVLKTGVIKRPLKLYVRFFKIEKHDFLRFYTEAILSNSTRKLLRFEVSNIPIAVKT